MKVHKLNQRVSHRSVGLIVTEADVFIPQCGEEPWTLGSKAWRWVTCARCRKERPKQGKRKKA